MTLKEQLTQVYNVDEGSDPEPLDAFLERLGTGPIAPYAVSSIERGMFRHGWAAEAVRAGLFDAHWEKDIEPRIQARLAETKYTNWSGD